ncbi:MAG: LysR family transcriptional regulator [Gammaproteobacteria bacterium]|nr:LysR family transcriptional regulator [Gammaproteobacteria bacterium]
MKLQQLRFLNAVVRNNLNVSSAANELYTSQPGVSHQIKLLEEELDIEIFERAGKKLTGITSAGYAVLEHVDELLANVKNIKQAAEEYSKFHRGSLSIATTHTQAKYVLPKIFHQFAKMYPNIELQIHLGNPREMCKLAASNQVDFVIATEGLDNFGEIQTIPCYKWNRYIIVPKQHSLAAKKSVTLADLAAFPILTYTMGICNQSIMQKAFKEEHLAPNVVLTATDSDVIKTYVELGIGVGIIGEMACTKLTREQFSLIYAQHLFKDSVNMIGFRQSRHIPEHQVAFINLLAPQLSKDIIKEVISTKDRASRDSKINSYPVKSFSNYYS